MSRRTAMLCTSSGLIATAFGVTVDRRRDPGPVPAATQEEVAAVPPPAAAPEPGRQAWMPDATRKPLSVNFTPGGLREMRGLILHVQEGENSLHTHFSDPAVQSSAHFWVAQSGEIEQYVSAHDRAWAQGTGNPSWLSVETSGFASRPLTAQQVDSVARIYAWGMAQHGWPLEPASTPLGRGLGIHRMGGRDWGGHSCPGPLRSAQAGEILSTVRTRYPR
ncbi:peptidoglycan recognition protein family protein [Streptomyces virginiae]|uniref:peptidoglycan recognition protein family protein n=1 Tax=Streptomyces virginiae TaxID=1961 RepID=UPI002DBF1B86|nr:peptidoglycan recognition family protein [Streptomyces sp. CMAA1738]MEC4570304.1 peptidoglycan recognition family protein [Streptomyces sp. CMAA1738]